MNSVVKKQHGFTLLELVVVVAVMGLIASLATEFVVQDSNQSRHEETKERISEIRSAVTNYFSDCNSFPNDLTDLIDTDSVAARCNDGDDSWSGPYIFNVDYEHCKDSDGNNLTGYPRLVYRDGWGTGFCEAAMIPGFANFGWNYESDGYDSAYPVLQSYGLDGASGALPSNDSGFNYNNDYPGSTYPLVKMTVGDFELRSTQTASAAVSVLSCYDNLAAVSTALANCFN